MGSERPRWERLLPGIATLRRYDPGWLRGDLVAGITVAAYLVPQVMAYAVIAGLSPVVGLWAVIVPMLLYGVLGSSRKLSVGPESTTAIMTAAGVGALIGAAGGGERHAEVAAIMAIAVGIVCLVGYVARLGFLTRLLSRPVLVGYLVGIAVLMIVSQLGKITKLDVEGDDTIGQAWSFLTQAPQAHLPTALFTVAVLTLLYVSRWLAPKLPGPLLVLLLAAGVVALFRMQRIGLEVVGEIPGGLPAFRIPALDDLSLWALLPYAVGIAVIGFSDNVLNARAFAAKHDRLDPNQELLALGAANIGGGLTQGFPVSSSSSRTVIGNTSGAQSQLHSVVAVGCVVLVLLFAGELLSSFPQAALGALVIYAATQLVDMKEIRRIARFRWSELALAGITAIGVVVFGVLIGIGLAVAISLLDLIRRITSPNASVIGYVDGVAGMHSITDYPDAVQIEGLVVFRYDSPLFFANADDFLMRALEAADGAPRPVHWFLLNAEANVEIDLTAVDTLQQLRRRLKSRGIRLTVARLKMDMYERLLPTGFVEKIGDEDIFPTLPTAVAAYAKWHEDEFGRLPDRLPPEIAEDLA